MRAILFAAPLTVAMIAGAAQAQDFDMGEIETGETVFKKCATCHKVGPDAKIGVGPVLNGIIGRTAGTYPDYKYSKANKESGVVWTRENLLIYLRAPKKFIPGTKMPFGGFKEDEDIIHLIAYLGQFGPDGEMVEQ